MAIWADIQHLIYQDNSGIFRGFPSILADHLADGLASAIATGFSNPHRIRHSSPNAPISIAWKMLYVLFLFYSAQ